LIIALVAGGVAGYFTGFVVGPQGYSYFTTDAGVAVASGFAGAVFGAILATLTGDANKSETTAGAGGGSRLFLGLFAGGFGGALGGTKFELVRLALLYCGIPVPWTPPMGFLWPLQIALMSCGLPVPF
jgi:hypothetical protein